MRKQKAKKALTTATAPEDTFGRVGLITAKKMSAERLKEFGLKTWEHSVVPTDPLPRTLKEKKVAEIENRFFDAKAKLLGNPEENSAAYQNANAEIWAAILDAIKLHRTEKALIHPEIALALEFELEYWLSGVSSPHLPLLTSPGRKDPPDVRSYKLTAVMYLAASPELTGDRRFRQTVRKYFGYDKTLLAESTLQDWKNKLYPEALKVLERFQTRLPDEERSKLLKFLLKADGKRYKSLRRR